MDNVEDMDGLEIDIGEKKKKYIYIYIYICVCVCVCVCVHFVCCMYQLFIYLLNAYESFYFE